IRYSNEAVLRNCIISKLLLLCCLSIGQCVRCCDTACYCVLIHTFIPMPYTSFVDMWVRKKCPILTPGFLSRHSMLTTLEDSVIHSFFVLLTYLSTVTR